MTELLDLNRVFLLHQKCIEQWKKSEVRLSQHDFLALVEENHAFNYQLWHAEDRARRDDMGAEFVYLAKREIDQFNQQRNNRMEAMDEWLYNALKPSEALDCPIHSETPGMIIDRLSIMALKIFHMQLQTQRDDASFDHQQLCQRKLETLIRQQRQLQMCLQVFIEEILNKTRSFKVYHQFKMYNDPNLNPELYARIKKA